jgi:hypothetical protein
MTAPKLRPGYLEADDIYAALAVEAPAGVDLNVLAAAFFADVANIEALDRVNSEVANAELAAYQRANDRLTALVETFLQKDR